MFYTRSRASSLSDLSTSVTFLATLFLLLFLSCAIILRSYILRRRYQRRLEEAMAAGLVLTPRAPGSRQTRFGVKPKIFDSWFINGDEKWMDVQVSISLTITTSFFIERIVILSRLPRNPSLSNGNAKTYPLQSCQMQTNSLSFYQTHPEVLQLIPWAWACGFGIDSGGIRNLLRQ